MRGAALHAHLARVRRHALACAAGAGAAAAVAAIDDVDQFLESWLLAFLFWIAFPLGAFAIVQLHHLTGGAWGIPVRRLLEAAARTLPLFVLLFLPVALGVDHLYEWSHSELVAADPVLRHKSAYLNVPFFLLRSALYFAAWIAVVRMQDRLAERRDRTGDAHLLRRQRALSGPATVVYALAMTFASVDWVMSLEPHWFSSIYGLGFIVGQGLTAFALAIVAASALLWREPLAVRIGPATFHDLGKLMLAFVLLWAYMSYSQFLLIWSGNLREEISWLVARTGGGWQWLALTLIALHFVLPFAVLLSRRVKREPRALVGVAVLLLCTRWLDLLWNVVPAFHPAGLRIHWLDVDLTLALGGVWLAAFAAQLRRRSLSSSDDARIERELGRTMTQSP